MSGAQCCVLRRLTRVLLESIGPEAHTPLAQAISAMQPCSDDRSTESLKKVWAATGRIGRFRFDRLSANGDLGLSAKGEWREWRWGLVRTGMGLANGKCNGMESGLSANGIGLSAELGPRQRGVDWGLVRMGLGLSANGSTGGSNGYHEVCGSSFRPAAE